MATSIVNISHMDIEELIRDVKEGKAMRLLKQIIKNNEMILKLQKQVVELQEVEKRERKRE